MFVNMFVNSCYFKCINVLQKIFSNKLFYSELLNNRHLVDIRPKKDTWKKHTKVLYYNTLSCRNKSLCHCQSLPANIKLGWK
jgi:hypothetical protein